jgi:hypothetical protein
MKMRSLCNPSDTKSRHHERPATSTVTIEKAKLEQVLEALEFSKPAWASGVFLDERKAKHTAAITAIKQARSTPVQGPSQYQELREVLEDLMDWQVKNVKVWHNRAYDNAQHVLDRHKATQPAAHGIKEAT